MIFDAGTVGLLCALAVVFGVLIGLYHSHHYMGSMAPAEVERRTRPWVPGKRLDAPAPDSSTVDVE